MSFNISKFYCARGLFGCNSSPLSPVEHIYSTDDPIEELAIPGYFPPYFGFKSDNIKNGDFIIVRAQGGIGGISYIVSVNPVSGEPFLFPSLNPVVTQTTTTQSNEFIGIWASPQPVMIDYVETGLLIQIRFPNVLAASNGVGSISLSAPPYRFPGRDIIIPLTIVDSGIEAPGKIIFDSDGTFIVSPLNGDFSGVGVSGFYQSTFSYNTFF